MTGFDDLNLKIQKILVISIFISSLNFMLSRVEYEKSFITSKPKPSFYCVLNGKQRTVKTNQTGQNSRLI